MRKAWGICMSVVFAAALVAAPGYAKTFRWASQGDVLSFDPYSQNESFNNTFNSYVYESLVQYDKKFDVVPQLAVKWEQISPTEWRFHLRPNVKFQEGEPFTADDVVFSVHRMLSKYSMMKSYLAGVTDAKKVDDLTVDIITGGPAPVLLRQLTDVRIMSKAWCEKHNVVEVQNYLGKEETYAVEHADGTGPYILKSREPDVKTVLVANPHWWGKMEGNVTEIVYTPIKQAATRTAALLSGEVDFVLDPPLQDLPKLLSDPNVKVVQGEENRTIFIGMDQARPELQYSNVKGKNPFKDLRVRQALNMSVDRETIKRTLMRGMSIPTGELVTHQIYGYDPAANIIPPYSVAKAKELLKEAGYPNGFEVTLDCPNDRYINDALICQALASMWAKVGLTVKLNAMPKAQYFAKINKNDTSLYMLGWAVATFDAQDALLNLVHTRNGKGAGEYNDGGYSNAKMDSLIDTMETEPDVKKRLGLIHEALMMHTTDVAHIMLHQQEIPWAMRKNIAVTHSADNRLRMWWVHVN
ncbi:MAG TPA: ABC transporter substrate-binding protein [Casimicrobiaceae bacterium]|nr:ABC transporter substrate-binding protein [Casimicrobiaceae bacterium]